MATPTPNKCAKCGIPVKLKVFLSVGDGGRLMCPNCYQGWFDVRDKLIKDAFKEYIGEDKVQSGNRTRRLPLKPVA